MISTELSDFFYYATIIEMVKGNVMNFKIAFYITRTNNKIYGRRGLSYYIGTLNI